MIITNKTNSVIPVTNSITGTVTNLKVGKSSYRLSLKDEGVRPKLMELRSAGKIDFAIPVEKPSKRTKS